MALAAEIWQVPVPLPRRILTPAGPFDTYHHLVVVLSDGDQTGWGYGALAAAAQLRDAAEEAARILAARPLTLESVLTVEELAAPAATTRAAVTAVAIAAWDLAGRRLGVRCADLWGRGVAARRVDCYGSGLFLDSTVDELVDEAADLRRRRFRLVKMRVGLALADDLARVDAVRRVFPEPGAIAVDAVCSWSPEQAVAFAGAVPRPLLWVEDATGYDRFGEVAAIAHPLAAGESLGSLADLAALHAAGRLDDALLDVQALGGPGAWLRAAGALGALGCRIGAHIFTPVSSHLLACVDDPLPLEVFDWSDPLMVDPPQPDEDGRVAVRGPGFGVELRRDVLADGAAGAPVRL